MPVVGFSSKSNPIYFEAAIGAVRLTAVKTAAYTAVAGDFVRADPSGGAFTINLPGVSNVEAGGSVEITNISTGANNVTVQPAGSDTIDGVVGTITLSSNESAKFVGNGVTGWIRVSGTSTSLSTANTWTASQNVASVALTDAASIATDASLGNVFTVTLADNRTLANPSNLVSGGTYQWIVTQDATGSRTLAYGTDFTWPGGTVPTFITQAFA